MYNEKKPYSLACVGVFVLFCSLSLGREGIVLSLFS